MYTYKCTYDIFYVCGLDSSLKTCYYFLQKHSVKMNRSIYETKVLHGYTKLV